MEEEGNRTGGNGKVISEGVGVQTLADSDASQEALKAQNEEKRGQGTTLLNPPPDTDAVVGGHGQLGDDPDHMEQTFNNQAGPEIQANGLQDSVDEGVRDRVKGPFDIEEKYMVLLFLV